LLRTAGLTSLLCLATATVVSAPAAALPVFAHRYGLSCEACHTTVPHLNSFGRAFAANGFRLDIPARGTFPVAVKANIAYSSEATPGLPHAVVDEVELLSGGSIGKRANYFLEQYVVDGGQRGRTRDAWVQINGGATHVRLGQFTLPLPVDPETQRDTEAHYLLFDQTVGDNGFNFFDPHMGIDAYTSARGFEAHLAALRAAGMLSIAKTFDGGSSLYAYRYDGQGFYRQGYGAGRSFGKAGVLAVVQRGHDGASSSSGGFVETHYTFSPSLMAVARYDCVWDALGGDRHQTVFSAIVRPRANMRLTIEDQIADRHTLNVGWLFAY
jgi:hypothetical protein